MAVEKNGVSGSGQLPQNIANFPATEMNAKRVTLKAARGRGRAAASDGGEA